MSYKKENLIKAISDNLAFSSKSTALRNVIGLFDSNRIAQDFFAKLFSLVFGYENLEELDKLNSVTNYPAIDLGDEKAKIAFQITTDSSSSKIKDTIDKFINHQLYKTYERLIIFIIGEKKFYTTSFDTQFKFVFDKEKDIWDDNFLINEIDKLDIREVELVQTFLEENLIEFKFPERLFSSDIKKCILILKRDFGNSTSITDFFGKNIKRDHEDFIKKKNEINTVSWGFFKEKIKGHLQYNKDIIDFISNPINKNLQKDYLEVSQTIQKFYKKESNNFESFEEVFRVVFDKVNILYDDNLNKIKIMILLHNMYFNCDIGDNPND